MYKIIIIIFALYVSAARSKRIDNTGDVRFVDNFHRTGLSSSGIEYPSTNNGITGEVGRFARRAKRSPLVFLVPVNEEHENADSKMTERSRPSRKIRRCKTALCRATNIPLSGEYGDRTVKGRAADSSGEPSARSARWKRIRTAKNSVLSKLFKKGTDSSENYEDDVDLAESLGKSLANERNYESPYPTDRKKEKFVCYCEKEDCPDCRSSGSKKELLGSPRTKENILAREKFKKDKYRKLIPNDYAIPKMPLVRRIPELYREIPYDLRRNHANAKKMQLVPIVHGVPSNVHPLTVPFRVAYNPADTYVGESDPVSRHQQKFNNNYRQYTPLGQYAIASESKSDVPNNGIVSPKNDLATTASHPKGKDNENDLDSEEDIDNNAFDSNMHECIKLFGRKVCVLAVPTNYDNLNKVKNEEDDRFAVGSNENVGSAHNYYETSSTEESSSYRNGNEDYYDVTESDMISNASRYNKINSEEDTDDEYRRITTEQSLGNYYEDYYDSTVSDVTSETPEYTTIDTDNDRISSDDYYDSKTSGYVIVDSTEGAILRATENQDKEHRLSSTTSVLTDTNSTGNTECTITNPESESSTFILQNESDNNCNDFATTKMEDKGSTDRTLGNEETHDVEEAQPEFDYSDIRVVTKGYFTSKGYDEFDENYLTGLDPSAYDYHLPNDDSRDLPENSPPYDTKVQATNHPEIIKDQSNPWNVLPTKSYSDLAESRSLIDSTTESNVDIDGTTMKDGADLLGGGRIICGNQERAAKDPPKESALKYDTLDPSTVIRTNSESELLGDAMPLDSLDYTTNNADSLDDSIDDYTARGTILTTTEENSAEFRRPEDSIATTRVYGQNLDPTVGLPDESFGLIESTDSIMSEENFSKDYDTTANPIANDAAKENESTTVPYLPFCDNTLLINSIRRVINNFTMDPSSLEDPYTSMDIANEEELSPEILEIPNLRSFLSLPQVENVIVKNVKDHLSNVVGLPENTLTGARPRDVIRNVLRNILGVLPKTQPELPPMTVMERRFQNNRWTTNLATLLPPSEETENQNPLQRIHDRVKDLIFNPAVGPQAAKQNAVQNIIVQAVKHQMENANDVEVEEDTIRDMVGNILGNAYRPKQDGDEESSSQSAMEDTTKRFDCMNNYDEATTEIVHSMEKNDENDKNDKNKSVNVKKNLERVTVAVPVTNNALDVESTSVSSTTLESLTTEISEMDDDSTDSPDLGREQPNDSSIRTENNNFSSTEFYVDNFQESRDTESTDVLATTSTNDLTNADEETTLGISHGEQRESGGNRGKSKGETNESEVLRLPQNSIVGAGNTGIGENSSANQGGSSLGKEKCRLCKIESCTSTHEIVTKVHKRVKTTTKKYYGVKENVASEGIPIVSSKNREESRDNLVGLKEKENQEDVNRSNDDDDVSTTCENLSDESFKDSESSEDFVYEEKISKKKTDNDDNDDPSDLENSELYYVGDNVKLPLEIKKLKDGSYALSISKSICENILKRKCPCCVPLEGNVRSIKRSNTDRVSSERKLRVGSRTSRERARRSTVLYKRSNWDDSNVKNKLETSTMPVVTFAKKYNLRLNLDDLEIKKDTSDRSKSNNIDIGSKKRSIERSNEITRNENKEIDERNDIYRDDDDRIEKVERDTSNPIFQRMKYINKIQKNPELYRHQRAIEGSPNDKIEIIKDLLNWFKTLILD